jgi:hypothetical protein
MKRLIGLTASVLLLVGLAAGPALARGVTTDQLERAGAVCFPVEGQPHCIVPGGLASDTSIPILVFDGWGAQGTFLGTELLLRADLYAGQPCPQDEVLFLPGAATGLGADYYACHHYAQE